MSPSLLVEWQLYCNAKDAVQHQTPVVISELTVVREEDCESLVQMGGNRKSKEQGALQMIELLKKLHKEESGQDLIEYALIAALIAVACVASMKTLATKINTEFGNVSAALP